MIEVTPIVISYFFHGSIFLRYLSIAMLLVVAGCARLPEYALPKIHRPNQETIVDEKSFSYRLLEITDFQSASLPDDLSGYNHTIQARSCISIRPTRDTNMRITRTIMSGEPVYMGGYSHISFQAIFNPSCSWWNPSVRRDRVDYVLEHEQIHFALTELSARKIDAQYRKSLKSHLAIGNTFREVRQELIEMAQSVSRKGLEEDISQHTAFDEETSLYYDLEAQRKWYAKVMKRLTEDGDQ